MKGLFNNFPSDLQPYIPDINHVFIALQSLSEEDITTIRNQLMASAIMAQKHAFNPIMLAHDLVKIFRLFPIKTDEGNFLKTIFVYLFKVSEVPKDEWVKAVETIPSDVKENLMTTYTWMKEEGIQIGRLEKQTEFILAMYMDKIPVQSIAKYTKLTEEEVVQILRKHDKIKDGYGNQKGL